MRPGASAIATVLAEARRRRARRALERQLDYQRAKSRDLDPGSAALLDAEFTAHAAQLADRLGRHRALAPTDRILEVGSGAHGHVFFLGREGCVGVDPLADAYRSLFPLWQGRARTVAASGESLPFADGSFDVVLSDNVVDHAEDPAAIVRELVRVLAPSGLLYFTVHVHHPLYERLSDLQLAAFALHLPLEIPAFADHTFHLTPAQAEALFEGLPLEVLECSTDVEATLREARRTPPRHVGDRLKRRFFKNATFELVARKRGRGATLGAAP